ncbi:hypothetical protein Ahia01_001388400 [Argonauta hians]
MTMCYGYNISQYKYYSLKPIHNLTENHKEVASKIGFLDDTFKQLHLAKLSEILDDGHYPLNISRIKARQGSQEKTILHIPLGDLNIVVSLKHSEPVLYENAPIVVTDGVEDKYFSTEARHCYLVGEIPDQKGRVVFSYCNGLRGSLLLNDVEYSVEPVDGEERHLVGELRERQKQSFIDEENELELEEDKLHSVVTIETGLYCDEDYTRRLEAKGADTLQKKIDFVVSKFTGVQYEYSKFKQLKHKVIIQLKKIVFWTKNPSWYNVTNKLNSILKPFCRWNMDKEPFDIAYVLTGHQPMSPIGLAYVGGVCNPKIRCGVSVGINWGKYVAIAHEMGHVLGMPHDGNTDCGSYPKEHRGLMGGKGTDFSNCSVARFEKKLFFNCVNLKEGPGFGIIRSQATKRVTGMYCAPGKVCIKKDCVSYTKMQLNKPWIVRAGGWGPWSSYSKCTRECGTGVEVATRKCNNPAPIQSHYCNGTEYKARLCNEQPCPTDPTTYKTIRKARADETCSRLIKDGTLDPKIYKPEGRMMTGSDYDDDCDVHCTNSAKKRSRDAILPDGTPCSSPDPDFVPEKTSKLKSYCLRGRCQVFGRDSRFPAKH